MDFSDYWSDVVWSIEMPSFDCLEDVYIIFIQQMAWCKNETAKRRDSWITETANTSKMLSVVPTTRNSSTTHRSHRTTREKWTVTCFWSCAIASLTVVVVRGRRILNSLLRWGEGGEGGRGAITSVCGSEICVGFSGIGLMPFNVNHSVCLE